MHFAGVAFALFQFAVFGHVFASVDPSSFEASTSVSADIPLLLAEANQTIAQNSSKYASAPFPIGIGQTTSISIYTNWPVLLHFCDADD